MRYSRLPGISFPKKSLRGWLILLAVAGASFSHAQDATIKAARGAQTGSLEAFYPAGAGLAGAVAGIGGFGAGFRASPFSVAPAPGIAGGVIPRPAPWYRSLLDAFLSPGRPVLYPATGGPGDSHHLLPPLYTGSRPAAGLEENGPPSPLLAALPGLNQLLHRSMNLGFGSNSSPGAFRLSSLGFFGSRGYALGGTGNQSNAVASYTTSRFGRSLMNLSAAAFVGSSPFCSPTLGAHKRTGPSASLRLTF